MSAVTLNEDEELPRETSYIVIGRSGWTDRLDYATIQVLERIHVIGWDSESSGPGFKTIFYRSIAAKN